MPVRAGVSLYSELLTCNNTYYISLRLIVNE